MDITEPASIDRAVAALLSELDRIDVYINSAGISHQGTILDTPLEAWNRVTDTNLTGFFYTTQQVAIRSLQQ